MKTEIQETPGAFGLAQTLPKIDQIYDLSIGEPRLSFFPQSVLEDLFNVQKLHFYYPSMGDTCLKKMILDKFYGGIEDQAIAITHGAIGAIDIIFRLTLSEGAEVLLPDPGFPPYEQLANFTKASVKKYNLQFLNAEQTINWDEVRSLITNRTKLMVINTPHNPTGRVFTQKDKLEFESLLIDFPGLMFVVDEVYRELIFDERSSMSFNHLLSRGFVVGSFSKMYPLQGARVGWLVTDNEKMKRIIPYLNNAYGAISSFGQELAKSFLVRKLNYQEVYAYAKKQTQKKLDELKLTYVEPEGAIYFFLYVGLNEQEIVQTLKDKGVYVIAGGQFGRNGLGYVRICFAQPTEQMNSALEIIAHVLESQNDNLREEALC